MSKANSVSKSNTPSLTSNPLGGGTSSRSRPHSHPHVRSEHHNENLKFQDHKISNYFPKKALISSLFIISIIAILMVIFMLFSGKVSATSVSATSTTEASGSAESAKAIKTIGISQIVEHPALNEVRLGILEALKEQGFEEGRNLNVIYENAQGNVTVSSQIANKLLSDNLDVGVAISTPSAQTLFFAAQRLEKKIPIVFTAVTDPLAAKLEPGKQAYPITGVTDKPNLEGLLEVIRVMMPNLKTLGIMYNPSEANSVSTVMELRKLMQTQGIKLHEVTVNSTNDVAAATQSMVGKVDALYFPQDNTVVSAIEAVVKVANHSSPTLPVILPIFTSDPVLVKRGVLAAVGFDYRDIGRDTGNIVAEILNGKAANEIPIENPSKLKTVVNKALASKLGLKIPKSLRLSTLEFVN